MTELESKYKSEFKKLLKDKFGISNINAVPNLTKIVVNAGIGGEFRTNTAVVEEMVETIAQITGQKPIITNAKEAIANFKLREGTPNGVKVTLRKDKMWNFYYKLVSIALPRIKDFRGVSRKSFDKSGNYSLGIKENIIFPEIDTSKLAKIRSLQIVINTTAKDNEQALELLTLLGMPFEKVKAINKNS